MSQRAAANLRREPHPLTRISKSMSYILRHGAEKEDIPMRADGFVAVTDLLQHQSLRKCTLETLQQVVANDNKQRYTLVQLPAGERNQWFIRANQGHSLLVSDLALAKIQSSTEIPVAIHGTYTRFWPSIEKEGLKRMSRNHIHLAPDVPGSAGVISGMRLNCEVYIYIDVAKAMADGIEFYRSQNGVILTAGQDGVLAPQYFAHVIHRS
ncbi:tRNA 2'-phosphotransferase [Dimargaris verticillata]|uniref:2'-phosphotransferase n=1 Tax=Dimargaris verticillata TaxID=2761393 RepID=A0A9W8E8G2_9FUNG|nr:tRNA 2'-phosphotransferase [Dimargaris verticillata]